MALWKFSNYNKYGNLRTRIISVPDDKQFSYKPKGLGPFVGVSRFHYESRSKYHGILTSPLDGKKYLTPDWIEVHPDTTINDIVYNEPEQVKVEPTVWEFKSDSSDAIYKVRYNGMKYTCNCFGYWRSQGNCKHVKEIRDGKN